MSEQHVWVTLMWRNTWDNYSGHRWSGHPNPLYLSVGWNRGSSGRLAPGCRLFDRISICPYVQEKEEKREAKKVTGPLAAQSVSQHSHSSLVLRLSHRTWKGIPRATGQSSCFCYSRPYIKTSQESVLPTYYKEVPLKGRTTSWCLRVLAHQVKQYTWCNCRASNNKSSS